MPHTCAVPLRWADMDLLGHVNNVTYLDYLAQARAAFLADLGAGSGRVTGHRIDFAAPLVFGRRPVLVDTWVSDVDGAELRLAHLVRDEAPSGSVTHLRAETTVVLDDAPDHSLRARLEDLRDEPLAWREVRGERRPGRHHLALSVRGSDLGADGLVRDDAVVEFFQESRILYFMDLHERGQDWGRVVVARTDVGLLAPVRPRAAAYDVQAWVAHVGQKSFVVRSELRDPDAGDAVLATGLVVLVGFDLDTQRPVALTDPQRERLRAELA
ncbi:acyl-CoA thioesterase [Nocardioides aurantiacus]|uniref:Acyl-CoA thioester hydrolase n=1 Tax=Nocardioides aurantiacus TaxID=86796 RepID=A0A3N2CW94_9ACTN|nr:thioesterase family protein [Nocardioides aurantiacus]ROR91688.1 acyl-CoA thioester hydrolase [Nocardioides aurantiacus]